MTQNCEAWDMACQCGVFKAANVYKELRGERVDVPWKKIFFQNRARPRSKFILWLILKGRLPTKERLERFGFINDVTCCFCDQTETLDHLFFACRWTYRIWKEMLEWNGYARNIRQWPQEQTWLIQEMGKKGWRREILKVTLAETVYQIWLSRNEAAFNNSLPRSDITRVIQERVVQRCLPHRKLKPHVSGNAVSLR
ncbi:uncharacterized protein LOC131650247 [Vicia villosa]|uniref:uncharacterized protein LOC131650247 n=1 Tax=Vicia villosa TaxID=3911 RepID=UPI00273CDA55|nr:uncharacterized protein LOC131650247 [Vicia villosa]